ncbi:response regulator receiver (CheY-like) modulated metal dependent phosphohydrolase [Sulfurimonas gotlandica GD1]|uniref:Response regulator receiver (CheY-like) modulated metal dependent phosphohydrolase n=1 Tax=Sulfurimonas gotlandica (strain DSM 19862 / JCM 16533 / GD1) TaxID=929558 RepID=B6BK33_SULGG|nr:HD domain-containing phosphohydrolase [Sulfurimonas gotlandica]EDZ62751.1 response regulator CheB [Sulfurimonas gotlandica GD1]EHP31124.1 response regulator receiver (CheY-like) modulated metal dependent phosphohydrolase [Sulfurimonas gotlandica GD1]
MDLSYNILIVDDVSDNIKVAMNILKENNYNFSFAINGNQALDIVKTKDFDLILLDIMMPDLNGFDVIKALKNNSSTKNIPIIFLTAKADIDSITEGFELGAVDYITKPFHPSELISRVSTHLELYRSRKVLEQNNLNLNVKIKHNENRLLSELEATQREIIYILTEVMESSSDETGRHIKRVAHLSEFLAELHESISDDEALIIKHASALHDIGKITIDQNILNKPDKLSEEEFCAMKEHTINAHTLLKNSKRKLIQASDIIAYQHHEKYNGKGYPQGLKGEEIHIYGRIVALADVLDALMHKRAYKDSWTFEEAAKYIIEHKGTQFDPYLVELFENNLDDFRDIVEE